VYFPPTSVWFTLFPENTRNTSTRFTSIGWVRRVCCNVFGVSPEIELDADNHPIPPTRHNFKAQIQAICMGAVLANGLVMFFLFSLRRRALWEGNRDRRVAAMVMTVTISRTAFWWSRFSKWGRTCASASRRKRLSLPWPPFFSSSVGIDAAPDLGLSDLRALSQPWLECPGAALKIARCFRPED
jgi:hypothetical protein